MKRTWSKPVRSSGAMVLHPTAPEFSVEGVGVFRGHTHGELVSVVIVVPHVKDGFDNHYQLYNTSIADRIEPDPDKDKSVVAFYILA